MENMVKMINAVTGSEMWVSRDRVFEYRMAGHRQAGKLFNSVATSQLVRTEPVKQKEEPREEKQQEPVKPEVKKPEPAKKSAKPVKSTAKQRGKK